MEKVLVGVYLPKELVSKIKNIVDRRSGGLSGFVEDAVRLLLEKRRRVVGDPSFRSRYMKMVLELYSRGYVDPRDISRRTGIPLNTVYVYLYRLRRKGVLSAPTSLKMLSIHISHLRKIMDRIMVTYVNQRKVERKMLDELDSEINYLYRISNMLIKEYGVLDVGKI